MRKILHVAALIIFVLFSQTSNATLKTATPANYTTFIAGLVAGDTLFLTAGDYVNGLSLNSKNGTAGNPIVIMGVSGAYTTVLRARSCCNTISITKCSYLVIKNMRVDGRGADSLIKYVDAVKAEFGTGNYAHHITIENLYIYNHWAGQQAVGISTKCSAWDWIIRGNTIFVAGTGLYLGNSDGTCPFVNGLIENNLVVHTIGYNMEIKHQLDTVRDNFTGTSTDNQTTIIRNNVWSKQYYASTGVNARPNVLLGAFPSTGYGANDHYEVYGNFFYQNPEEALLQATGNVSVYNNVFVNDSTPAGYYTVRFTNHNSFSPRKINFFHNTVVSYAPGGISLNNPNSGYQQYCYGNAVFSNLPINGFTNSVDNITNTYLNAGTYLNSAPATLTALDVYPKAGQLQGTLTSNAFFTGLTDYNKDFNANTYDWTYRGAYSGSGTNPGWHLKLELKNATSIPTGGRETEGVNDFLGKVYPNPANKSFDLSLEMDKKQTLKVELRNLEGQVIQLMHEGELSPGTHKITTNIDNLAGGFYLVTIQTNNKNITRKLLITK